MKILDAYANAIFDGVDPDVPKFIYTFEAISEKSKPVKIALRDDVTVVDHQSNGMASSEKRLEVPWRSRRTVVHLDTAVGWGLAIPMDEGLLLPGVVNVAATDVTKEQNEG